MWTKTSLPAVSGLDEAEAFGGVEPFDSAGSHFSASVRVWRPEHPVRRRGLRKSASKDFRANDGLQERVQQRSIASVIARSGVE